MEDGLTWKLGLWLEDFTSALVGIDDSVSTLALGLLGCRMV